MDDVAVAAGVSRALVSLVMRESPRVSAASRAAVLEAAARLGYRPNLMARNLAARRTNTIGLLLNDLHNPWYADIADGIDQVADANGYQVILASGRRAAMHESRAIDTFLASRVDGIIVTGCRLPVPRLTSVAAEVPLVSVGRTLRAAMIGTVCTDDAVGARLAVRHLHSLGHRRIAHIDGGVGAGSAPRRAGYVAAMRELGLAAQARVATGDFTEEAGAAAVDHLLRDGDPPSAIFAANDLSAIGAIDELERRGLDVPAQVSVVGYDNTALAALNHIGLSTIDQPRLSMGNAAAAMLVAALTGAGRLHNVSMAPQLVARSTTAAAPSHARPAARR
jgi:DNA-binding LacI/PurR family transcriptional regulator